jgi:hypothetical protein
VDEHRYMSYTPLRYRINGSNYSLRSIISEFGCAIF